MVSKQDLLQSMHANYAAWYVPFWKTGWFYMLAGIIGMVVLGFIGYIVYKRLKKPKHPLENIEDMFHAMLEREIVTQEQVHQGYVVFTQALKEYVYFHYHENMLFSTEDQLANWLFACDQKVYHHIHEIIKRAQVSKYAMEERVIQEAVQYLQSDIQFLLKLVQEHNASLHKK